LYIVDLYRGVIQHRISLTTYLRRQIEQRGLDKPLALGRIWRIVPEGKSPSPEKPLSEMKPAEWIEQLSHGNAWRRETSQRLLVETQDQSLIPLLEKVAVRGEKPLGRLHALWTLEGLRAAGWEVLSRAFSDTDARVRAAAIRISEGLLVTPHREALVTRWISCTQTETIPEVQLQLALSLGEAADPRADLAGARLISKGPSLPLFTDALVSGFKGRELELLERLLDAAENGPPSVELLKTLAVCTFSERNPEHIERLLERIATLPADASGLLPTLLGALGNHHSVHAKKPARLPHEPKALNQIPSNKDEGLQKMLAQVRAALEWPGKPGVKAPTARALTADEQDRFERGKQTFLGLCAACHQPNGKGLEGLAPPLVDSEWVTGSVERTARILLHGVRGPLRVKQITYHLDMPAAGFLSDTQIADVLTFIRREWSHEAEPVTASEVTRIRQSTSKRQDAWTEPELLRIP
jgi:mono/diheme cytochrome c family protein